MDIPIELLKVFDKGGVFYGEDGLRYNIDTYRVKDHEESKLVWKEYALINFGTPESKGLLVKCSPENMRTVWYIIFYSMNLEVFAYEVPFEVVQVLGDGLFQARDTFGYYTIEDNKLIDHVVIWWDLDRKEYIQQDGRTPCYDEIIMEHGYSLNFTPF